MFIEQDKLDKTLYKIQKESNAGLQTLEEDGAKKAQVWPETVSDLWAGLFKAEPKIEPNAVGPLANALKDVMTTQEWQNLRSLTKLDEFGSAVGTVTFGREFLDRLPEEVLKAEDAAKKEEQAQKAVHKAESGNYPDALRKKLRELAEQRAQEAAVAAAKANKACDGDIAQAVRIAARNAATQAAEETVDAQEFARAWGNGTGTGKVLTLKQQLETANKIKNDKMMRAFAKMIGRMKRLAEGYQAKKIEKHPEEIVNIETGNALNSIIPAEFARLQHPLAKLDFKRRFMEQNLLQYKKTGTDKTGKGPIMLMVDESGSMDGNRIVWAKAVGMALCWIAQKQKRSMILGGFSSGGQVWTKEYRDGKMTSADVEAFAKHFYCGGTDFQMALEQCIASIKGTDMPNFKKADVVFISDGDCYISDGYRNKFKAIKKEMALRVIAVGVGCSADSFRDFSDAAFGFRGSLDADETALERIFSI